MSGRANHGGPVNSVHGPWSRTIHQTLLSHRSWFGRTTVMVQYRRVLDHLVDYARAHNSEHLPTWREFNKQVASTGNIGIWHKTYAVQAGRYESVYHPLPLPPFGLARAGELVEAIGCRHKASGRLAAQAG
ncbi:MAG: DUF4188 domain-containing protein, partial [Myxococcota bacterium]